MKNWRTRDWIWLTTCLLVLIVIFVSLNIYNIQPLTEFITFAFTLSSMLLALLAIFITLIYSKDTKDIHASTEQALIQINSDIGSLDKKIELYDPAIMVKQLKEEIREPILKSVNSQDREKIDNLINKHFSEFNDHLNNVSNELDFNNHEINFISKKNKSLINHDKFSIRVKNKDSLGPKDIIDFLENKLNTKFLLNKYKYTEGKLELIVAVSKNTLQHKDIFKALIDHPLIDKEELGVFHVG